MGDAKVPKFGVSEPGVTRSEWQSNTVRCAFAGYNAAIGGFRSLDLKKFSDTTWMDVLLHKHWADLQTGKLKA
jgi:hypothetical protein